MFTKSQENALNIIKDFIKSDDTAMCLSGSPGTGKTYLVNEGIPAVVEGTGYHLAITAMTNKAASLINGCTIHSMLGIKMENNYKNGTSNFNLNNVRSLSDSLIIIDEASMMDSNLYDVLMNNIYNCKILFVGDKYQLPAVKNRLDVFSMYHTIELNEVVRQTNQDFLNIIGKAKMKVIEQVFEPEFKDTCSCVKVVNLEDKDFIKQLLSSFNPVKDKVLCYSNEAVHTFNVGVRKLHNKPAELIPNDDVICRNYCENLLHGTRTAIKAEQRLTIEDITPPYAIQLGKGTLSVRDITFKEIGETWTCANDWHEYRDILNSTAKAKDWTTHFAFKEKVADIRSIEACTIHTAQGSTYDRVFINYDDIVAHPRIGKFCQSRLFYVALTRAKKEVYIYGKNL
jgi:exodeoxyribonuclease V